MQEKHHIIFKSQGGLDFPLNYEYLTEEEHRGNHGPHRSRKIDLMYKKKFERRLRNLLTKKHYKIEELIEMLELKPKQAHKAFKRIEKTGRGISRGNVVKRLLGGKYYL